MIYLSQQADYYERNFTQDEYNNVITKLTDSGTHLAIGDNGLILITKIKFVWENIRYYFGFENRAQKEKVGSEFLKFLLFGHTNDFIDPSSALFTSLSSKILNNNYKVSKSVKKSFIVLNDNSLDSYQKFVQLVKITECFHQKHKKALLPAYMNRDSDEQCPERVNEPFGSTYLYLANRVFSNTKKALYYFNKSAAIFYSLENEKINDLARSFDSFVRRHDDIENAEIGSFCASIANIHRRQLSLFSDILQYYKLAEQYEYELNDNELAYIVSHYISVGDVDEIETYESKFHDPSHPVAIEGCILIAKKILSSASGYFSSFFKDDEVIDALPFIMRLLKDGKLREERYFKDFQIIFDLAIKSTMNLSELQSLCLVWAKAFGASGKPLKSIYMYIAAIRCDQNSLKKTSELITDLTLYNAYISTVDYSKEIVELIEQALSFIELKKHFKVTKALFSSNITISCLTKGVLKFQGPRAPFAIETGAALHCLKAKILEKIFPKKKKEILNSYLMACALSPKNPHGHEALFAKNNSIAVNINQEIKTYKNKYYKWHP